MKIVATKDFSRGPVLHLSWAWVEPALMGPKTFSSDIQDLQSFFKRRASSCALEISTDIMRSFKSDFKKSLGTSLRQASRVV